jgi:hypothetical protein
MSKSREHSADWLIFIRRKSSQFQPSRHPALTDQLARYLRECPRCGGVGCKECRHGRAVLERCGYEPDDQIGAREPDEIDAEDGNAPSAFEDDEDIVDDDAENEGRRRKRRETEDESFARRLAMGVSMLAGGDDSILDD